MKPRPKFKVGDRISLGGLHGRQFGTVVDVLPLPASTWDAFHVQFDDEETPSWVYSTDDTLVPATLLDELTEQ